MTKKIKTTPAHAFGGEATQSSYQYQNSLHALHPNRRANLPGDREKTGPSCTFCSFELGQLSITLRAAVEMPWARSSSLPFTDGYAVAFEQRLTHSPFESDICN